MRAVLALAAALLAAGCANLPPNRPATPPELRAIAAARAAWDAAGRPGTARTEVDPERVIVSELPREELFGWCAACYPGPECREVRACLWMPNVHAFDAPRAHVLVLTGVDGETHIALVVHEYLHALRGTVVLELLERGAELPAWAVQGEAGAAGDLPDRPHRDVALWGAIEADALRRWRASR